MRNKIKAILLSAMVFWTVEIVKAQTGKDNYFPPSPEASSLMKYVDVPVNYSTGVTSYSIPIHNIKLKKLNIPITMSYQSSGMKPSEVAANTGLGWELNAGGKIVQNVSGQSDTEGYGAHNNFGNLPNERDFKLPLPSTDLNWTKSQYSKNQLDSIRGAGTDYTKLYDIDQYNVDTKPDLFYYSMPNKSGKFFYGDNFEIKQIPFGKEKIVGGGGGFEIVDTDGVRYIYGIHTISYNLTQHVSQKFPSLSGSSRSNSYTYYLSKIITPDNETVDFIYETVKYNLIKDKDYTRYYHSIYGGGEKVTSYYSEINAKVLTKIKVNEDYEIDFLYNKFRKDILGTEQATAPKTLDNIKIKYKNEVENYSLDYGYFGINDGTYNPSNFESLLVNENSGFILKLKSIQKTGETPYSFSYFNEMAVDRYTPCLDHWGYYNEMCSRYTMNTLFGDFNVQQKDPDLEKTKTNVLKGITLPTKGEVEFNYQLNDCFNFDISYPVYDWPTYGPYVNEDDDLSDQMVEIIRKVPVPEKYYTVPMVHFNIYSEGPATTENNVQVYLYDDQNNQIDFQLTGIGNQIKPYIGTPLIGGKEYRLVLKCKDNEINQNKFVTIKFLTTAEGQTVIPSVGGLRIESIKTKDQNNIQTIRSFEYQEDGKSSGFLYEKPSYADEYSYFVEYNGSDNNALDTGLISYVVQHSRMPSDLFGFNGSHIFYKKVTENFVNATNASEKIKTEKYFTFYDDIRYGEQSYFSKISYNWKRGLPLQTNEFRNNDIVKKTIFSYRFLDTPPGNNISKYEVGFPLNNPIFPNEYYKRTIDLTVYRRSNFYNLYQYTNSRLTSAWYYMDKKTTEENLDGKILKTEEEYKYDNPVHAQLTSQTTTNSNGQKIEIKYYYPDDFLGEPFMLELKTANRISTPVITEQYKGGTLLSKSRTVFAKDASTSNIILPKEIYSAKFPNDFPDIQNIGSLEKKITYDLYDDKGNVLQYTATDNIPVSIIWGYSKSQFVPIAKIENAVYSSIPSSTLADIQTLSDLDNDNCLSANCSEQQFQTALNSLRSALPNAFITTYTYNPLVGVTSITDPKGIASYYEYDTAGRLKFIKDKDLNVLQKYCYNYKGQQTDCSDNTSTSTFIYKSAARSGIFTRTNCGAGGIGLTVLYNQPAGAVTSTISQEDADNSAMAKFNADGEAYANANVNGCAFYSAALSGSFTKNNCAAGGTGSSVTYSQVYGAAHSNSSQADADRLGLDKFNADGQAYANASGYCTFYSAALNGSFSKNDCPAGGTGTAVNFSQVYGAEQSNSSQADADSRALIKFNNEGRAYANAHGKCIFYNTVQSGSFTRNNCAAGGTPESVVYTVPAGRYNSEASQADADVQAQNDVTINGMSYANANARCQFSNTAKSGLFTRNNCAAGGLPESLWYTVAAGTYFSYHSQADADVQAQYVVDTNGQAYANANAKCTFSNGAKAGLFTRNNCASGGTPESLWYVVNAGIYFSNSSQADADAQAQNVVNANGQAYVNAAGKCTFRSAYQTSFFTKNDCPTGSTPLGVWYTVATGKYSSDISQAHADAQALNEINANGQANANAFGRCTFWNTAQSRWIARNNCAAGGIPESVLYTVPAGVYSSIISQAAADAAAQDQINNQGQSFANNTAKCTFYSKQILEKVYKNDYCPPDTTFPYVYYHVEYGKYKSTISQSDADTQAWNEFGANAQAYANANGVCLKAGELEE